MVDAGVTFIAAVLSPVFQAYEEPPMPIKLAVAPSQITPSFVIVPDVSVTVMPGVGSGFTVMVLVVVAVKQFALVTVTVYVFVDAGVTLIAAVLSPVLQA